MSNDEEIPRLLPFGPPSARAALRLFCLPYAGGNAAIYRGWSERLGPHVDVCPIELPGRGARIDEPPIARMSLMVQRLSLALRPHVSAPFALFGHSMGALLAFELARELRRTRGVEPRALYVSGCSAPHLQERRHPIHALPHDLFVEELRALKGTPEAVLADPELLELLLPAVRADFAVVETYRHVEGPLLDVPIRAFAGAADPEAEPHTVAAWSRHTRGELTFDLLPGDHFFIHAQRAELLARLSGDLSRRGDHGAAAHASPPR